MTHLVHTHPTHLFQYLETPTSATLDIFFLLFWLFISLLAVITSTQNHKIIQFVESIFYNPPPHTRAIFLTNCSSQIVLLSLFLTPQLSPHTHTSIIPNLLPLLRSMFVIQFHYSNNKNNYIVMVIAYRDGDYGNFGLSRAKRHLKYGGVIYPLKWAAERFWRNFSDSCPKHMFAWLRWFAPQSLVLSRSKMNSLRLTGRIASRYLTSTSQLTNSRVLQTLPSVQFQSQRYRHNARINTAVVFVPQQEAWIIERMGRFNKILGILSIIDDYSIIIFF